MNQDEERWRRNELDLSDKFTPENYKVTNDAADAAKTTGDLLTILFYLAAGVFGWIAALGILSYQFLIRPVATLLMLALWFAVFAVIALFVALVEFIGLWFVSVIFFIFIASMIMYGGIFLMQKTQEIVEFLDVLEVHQRQIVRQWPEGLRIPLVTLESLMPIIVLGLGLYFGVQYFDAVEVWIIVIVIMAVLIIQVISIIKRSIASNDYGDYTPFGFTIKSHLETK